MKSTQVIALIGLVSYCACINQKSVNSNSPTNWRTITVSQGIREYLKKMDIRKASSSDREKLKTLDYSKMISYQTQFVVGTNHAIVFYDTRLKKYRCVKIWEKRSGAIEVLKDATTFEKNSLGSICNIPALPK